MNTAVDVVMPSVASMCHLSNTTEEEVFNIISKSKASTCELDPLPTTLLKECLESALPVIIQLVNLSLLTAKFPTVFKHALVWPLLKKQNLDCETLNNFRPVSNLSFIGKVVEKVVAKKLTDHMTANNLH